MQSIEFTTHLKHGRIHIPPDVKLPESRLVKVILLVEEETDPALSGSRTELYSQTAGAWVGESLEREPVSDSEQRLELE